MNLRQLIYFKTVCEAKTISKASEKLFLPHQTISQAIQALEKEYGVVLFNRTPKGMILTDAGKQFFTFADQILLLDQELREAFCLESKYLHIETSPIRIATSYIFNEHLLPSVYAELEEKSKCCSIYKKEIMSEKDILDAVKNKTADIGLLNNIYIDNNSILEIPEELNFIPLLKRKYNILVNKESALSKYKTISIKKLFQYPMLFVEDSVFSNKKPNLMLSLLSYYGKPNLFLVDSRKYYIEKLLTNKDVVGFYISGIEIGKNNNFTSVSIRENIFTYLGYVFHKDIDYSIIKPLIEIIKNSPYNFFNA